MELYIEPVLKNGDRDMHGRFVKGIKPWNKGLRFKGVFYNDTQFKTGSKPHNTKPDWHVSLRKEKKSEMVYKHIKVPGRGYVPLHRWVYEIEYGKIPHGCIVRFINGDTLNCCKENLELITMKQNLLRNQNRDKAAESMKALWKRERIRKSLELKPLTKLGHGGRKKRDTACAV